MNSLNMKLNIYLQNQLYLSPLNYKFSRYRKKSLIRINYFIDRNTKHCDEGCPNRYIKPHTTSYNLCSIMV